MQDNKVNILISNIESPKFKFYIDALESAGACARGGYLPEYDDECDGLLIGGGWDVHPSRYGESTDNGVKNIDELRDKCEYELLDKFTAAGKPVFGICRGMQILNVYSGGSLIGDLPKTPPHVGEDDTLCHDIRIEENSILYDLFGSEMTVNSLHHQAVKALAPGFKVTARSLDGVVEAIQHEDKPWFGVQFHPERMIRDGMCAEPIFEYFVSLCKNRNV